MAFFLSKEYKEERVKEKELKRQMEQEQEEKELKEKMKYCNWYSRHTQNFIDELKRKGFEPTWGFEVEPACDTHSGRGGKQRGSIFVFDIPALEGLAFDMESKQMLYFTCPTGYYDSYCSPNTRVDFKYVLIPFHEIFNANMEVNSQSFISTTTSKQNVVGRSIVGGILAGEAGAIIGGMTGDDISVSKSDIRPRKIVFNIQTTHPDYPIISFEFKKTYDSDERSVESDKAIIDTMYSIFSNSIEHAGFYESKQNRNCNTSIDYHYYRQSHIPDYDGNNLDEYWPIHDYIKKIAYLDTIMKRVNKYVMKIEAIIQQCNKELQNKTEKESFDDIVSQLEKLADMKSKGIITEEEFIKLKSKYIE